MVVGAELVGHGVVEAEERVGEGHAGKAGGVGHALAGLGGCRAVVIGARQIVEDKLHRAQRHGVAPVAGHDRDVGLEGVGEDVNARGAREALGLGVHVVGVNDCHVGQQRVVCERPLDARLGVRDDGERRALGAGARGGRDGHEVGLRAHLRVGVDPLADVHEIHGHVLEVGLGVLVEDPHDLAGVHGRTAAEGDDHVGLKAREDLRTLARALQRGVRGDVPEAGVLDAQLVELLLDGLDEAVLEQELVRDDERALLVHDTAELVEGHGLAAPLEVDLLGCAEPEHVLPPLCDRLDVEQVLGAHVLGDGVAAPGAAAQREGRGGLEVVEVADAALGGRGVDEDATGLHGLGVLGHLLLLRRGDEQRGGVAVAAVRHEALGLGDGLVERLGLVHAQDRRELLVGHLLGGLHARDLADEDLGLLGHVDASHLGDGVSALAHDLGVDRAVDDDGLADLVELGALEEVAAASLELGLDGVVNVLEHRDGLLGGADHAVVEGLGVDD